MLEGAIACGTSGYISNVIRLVMNQIISSFKWEENELIEEIDEYLEKQKVHLMVAPEFAQILMKMYAHNAEFHF
jgi:predicted ATP-grasp superfamily ATP-dependent carboligase